MSLLGTMCGVGATKSRAAPQVDDYGATVLAMAPLAYWRKNEASGTQITDEMAGARHGTYSGAPIFGVPGLPTLSDNAVDYAGIASGSVPHSAGLLLSTFSLSFWFRAQELDPEALQFVALLTKNSASVLSGDFQIGLFENDEQLRVRFRTASATNEDVTGTAPLDQRHHVCVRADSTGFDVYLNGKYLGKNTNHTGAWAANTNALLFAASNIAGDAGANTRLDEVALFSRILTEDEVLTLAQRTTTLPVTVNDTVNVSESGTTAIDVTANDSFVGAKSGLTIEIMSQPAGGDSVAVNGSNNIAYTAGAVSEDTARSFTYRITDRNGTSNTATVSVTVVDSAVQTSDAPFFGLAFGDDTLNANPSNSRLTASNTAGHSDFFWAERTGTITHARWQFRAAGQDAGYSDGNGGIYTVEIRKADPDAKLPLLGASDLICQVNNIDADVNATHWITVAFTTTGQIIKGQPYCLVYRNTGADPTNNYVSENRSLQYGNAPGDADVPPTGGWTPITLPAGLSGAGRAHKPYPTWTRFPPTLTLNRIGMGHWNIRYSDGQWVGCGGIAQLANPASHLIVSGDMVRMRFRPWRTHVVTGVSTSVQRRNASGGTLVATLESGPASGSSGNGSQIDQATIAASSLFNIGAAQTYDMNNHKVYWNTFNFSQPRTLNAGTIYTIRLSASGGLDARICCSYRGEHSNIQWSQPFSDFAAHEAGQTLSWSAWEYSLGLQISSNSGSTWAFPTGNNRQTCPLLVLCTP